MSNVRVTYSGLIGFSIIIVSTITGMFFSILITRKLSIEDFGLWTLISSILGYVVIIEPIVNYWTTREIAQGNDVGKTTLLGSSFLTIFGVMIYSIIAFFMSTSLQENLSLFLLATMIIPISIINNSLVSICKGFRPQAISYSLLLFQASKVPVGIYFVLVQSMGISGVILALFLSNIARLIFLLFLCKEKIVGKVNYSILKSWYKVSWLTLFSSGSRLLHTFDVLIFSLMTSSLIGVAIFGVSQAIAGKIGLSSSLSQGVFPKLLANKQKDVVEQNWKLLMLFSMPLVIFTIYLAKPLLHILNPVYTEYYPVLIILSIFTILGLVRKLYDNVLLAFEKIEVRQSVKSSDYIHSQHFKTPLRYYLQFGSYLTLLVVSLFLIRNSFNDYFLVLIWSLLLFFTAIPFVLYGAYSIKKSHYVNLSYKHSLKYLLFSVISGVPVYLLEVFTLEYSQSIWDFLPQILPIMLIGTLTYFSLVYFFDSFAKRLIASFLNELKK